MKILLVITKSEIGGAQVFVLNLARSLKRSGLDVEVAAGDGNYLFGELEKDNIKFHYLNSLKRNFSVFNSFYFIYDLHRLLKKNKYDVVHLNSSNTLIGAISTSFLKEKPKTVFTFHGLSFIDNNYQANVFFKMLAKFYYKLLLNTVNRVVFECNLNYKEVKEAGMVKNAEVIYNGLDEKEMSFLSGKDARIYFSEKCGMDLTDNFLIGSTGRLIYQKNYDFLIHNYLRIKEKIPNAKVVIVGDGPDRKNYEVLIQKLGIQNDFLLAGELKNSHQYMKGFDVFTLSSRYEGVSISLIEALYAGIPILASNVGGNPDVVGNSQNQLFVLDDFDDYISKLVVIKKNRETIIKFNASIKHRFSLVSMMNHYKHLYEELNK
ncbi:MAG: glycosyltransferase [Melioribacteraceae bacterium]